MSDCNLRTDTARARKRYLCNWCGELIEPGESYVRDVGVYQGDFYSQPYHAECNEAFFEWSMDAVPGDEFSSWGMARGKPWPYGEGG